MERSKEKQSSGSLNSNRDKSLLNQAYDPLSLFKNLPKYSSSAATLVALLPANRGVTHPEYAAKANVRSLLPLRANILAMKLIGLWIPKHPRELDNFIPRYFFSSTTSQVSLSFKHRRVDANPFYNTPSTQMQEYFKNQKVQNLGALAFLNLFLEGGINSQHLAVALSPDTEIPYFTQRVCGFWRGYFKGDTLLNTASSTELTKFIYNGKYTRWWDKVTADIKGEDEIYSLFLEEIFIIVLRVFVTPNCLIKEMADETIGFSAEAKAFTQYLIAKKENVVNDFIRQLSGLNQQKLEAFRDRFGHQIYLNYEDDIYNYVKKENPISQCNQAIDFNIQMFMNADRIGIPNLNDSKMIQYVSTMTVRDKSDAVSCVLEQMRLNWGFVGRFSNNALWDLADNFTLNLHTEMMERGNIFAVGRVIMEFSLYLLVKAIKYNKNNLAKFIIIQFPMLVNASISDSSYLLAEEQPYKNKSVLFYTAEQGNTEIADFLKEQNSHTFATDKTDCIKARRRKRTSSFFVANEGSMNIYDGNAAFVLPEAVLGSSSLRANTSSQTTLYEDDHAVSLYDSTL
jgi:hypothetical protein